MINLIGQKFERLLVLEYVGKDKWKHNLWRCRCDCGQEKIVLGNSLLAKHTRSCGCLGFESKSKNGKLNIKHGHAKGAGKSKTYMVWVSMKARCTRPNHKAYKNYGGRDKPITVCGRWLPKNDGFIHFLEDMGECPLGLSLDRINNDLGYYKENCQWATRKEQQRNKRNSRILKFANEEQCMTAMAEKYEIDRGTLSSRLNESNMSIEKALTTPVKHKKKKNVQ